ncbi:SCO1860 family LAETG-anchored protein [Streptomyces nitrosporeus]|uniref:SCO1860 family LAETG-anchored protein n=1 Tax=Streptomyces nitrosporeus TaxID=28894 RepID=UPI00399EE92A
MNSNTFRLAALAVAAAPVALLAAVPAQAATTTVPATPGGDGKAGAVVLRTGLDVKLLDRAVHLPLTATLNEVRAPETGKRTALSVELDGVERGEPVKVLRADVATAHATADEHRAEGYTNLVKARLHVPGLPLLSLIEVEKVTSRALCETGRKPVAESNVLGHVSVLGKRTTLSSGGTTRIEVPGVGSVTLDLSKTGTTTDTAAATALQLKIAVDPLALNVAEVEGEITLAEATCRTPEGGGPDSGGHENGGSGSGGHENGGSDNGGSGNGGSSSGTSGTSGTSGGATGGDGGASDGGATAVGSSSGTAAGGGTAGGGDDGGEVKPQTGTDDTAAPGTGDLAETGSSSSTPYIAGGAAVLLAAGAGATALARRRARN